MKRAFLEAYNRELSLLYERSKDFAAEYPGIAERLGGLTQDNLDPAVAGLLEGSAFLAARVQLKIADEFETFTREMLDQLLPGYQAPTPSAMVVQAQPDFSDKDLEAGKTFPRGSYMDATYIEREERISCRYALCAPLTLWPLEISEATYVASAGPFQALGLDVANKMAAGLHLNIRRPTPEGVKKGRMKIGDVKLDRLDVHLLGDRAESIRIYEQLMADTVRITLRWLDERGDPVFARLPEGALEQIGFDEEDLLFPEDMRVYSGFNLLREFFILPRKFLGFRLKGLSRILPRVSGDNVDVLIEFDTGQNKLRNKVTKENFGLCCVPAINLFEENCSQVAITPGKHEYIVVPDSSPSSHYEIHRIKSVSAYYAGVSTKLPVYSLYAVPADGADPRESLYYTTRTRARRLSQKERRFGAKSGYKGTETFISLFEPAGLDDEERVKRLQVRALCSNRHLPEYLPIGQSGADFHLNDDTSVRLRCVAGPTSPAESLTELEQDAAHRYSAGEVNWRLISFLSLNYLGLDGRGAGDSAAALRELLTLFADVSSAVTERQIGGLLAVDTRPVTRSIERGGAFHAARGIEVKLTFDERAFEGSGIMLIGAVLDRFFAEYSSINSFSQTVIASSERGEVMRWPPRTGMGPLL